MLILLVTQFGLILYCFLSGILESSDLGKVIQNEIFYPYVLYASLLGCMMYANQFFAKRNKPTQNAYAQMIVLSLICFCASMFNAHYAFGAAGAIMAIPLMSSLFYLDFKPLNLSFILNTLLLSLFCIFNIGEYRELVEWRLPGVVAIIFFIFFIFYFMACLTLNNTIELMEETIVKDQKLARDSFTGLLNHAAFYNHLDQLILENHRDETVFSLIIWDLDNFKSINDRFGHEIGDRVLTWFVRALKEQTDEDHDLCFRYGGEEFAALIRSDIDAAYQLSCEVRERFTQYTASMPMLGKLLTASAGICEYSRQFGGSREFFSAADRALYTAKKVPGKNTSSVWTDDMLEESIIRQYLKRSMFKSDETEPEENDLTDSEQDS